MTVKMMAHLPRDAGDNGLLAIEGDLIKDLDEGAGGTWLVVGLVKAKRYTVEDDGSHIPTAYFVHVEVLAGPERGSAEKLLRDRHQQRTGEQTLPFEVEAAASPDDEDGDRDGEE